MLNLTFSIEDNNKFVVKNDKFDERLRAIDSITGVVGASIYSCSCPQVSVDQGCVYLNGEDRHLDSIETSGTSNTANLKLFKERLELSVKIFNIFNKDA